MNISGTELKDWDVDEVCTWLRENQLAALYETSFRTKKINGAAFIKLTEKDLQTNLNVTNEIHVKMILEQVNSPPPYQEARQTVREIITGLSLFPQVPAVLLDIIVEYWIESQFAFDIKSLKPLPSDAEAVKNNQLGRGAGGLVYRAEYGDRKESVAVKILCDNPYQIHSKEALLLKEGKLMMQSYHPNIGLVYGIHLKSCALIMEYAELGNLTDYLANTKKYPQIKWTTRLRIALDIISGVAFLHSQSITHRDLKGQNILIRTDLSAFITDFGIARLKLTELSRFTSGIGTLPYMAPEMIKGPDHRISATIDIYSFGMILYELLTREIPFNNYHNAVDLATDVLNGVRPSISELQKKLCPAGYIELMLECWEKDPEKRPTAASIVSRIQSMLKDPFFSLINSHQNKKKKFTISLPQKLRKKSKSPESSAKESKSPENSPENKSETFTTKQQQESKYLENGDDNKFVKLQTESKSSENSTNNSKSSESSAENKSDTTPKKKLRISFSGLRSKSPKRIETISECKHKWTSVCSLCFTSENHKHPGRNCIINATVCLHCHAQRLPDLASVSAEDRRFTLESTNPEQTERKKFSSSLSPLRSKSPKRISVEKENVISESRHQQKKLFSKFRSKSIKPLQTSNGDDNKGIKKLIGRIRSPKSPKNEGKQEARHLDDDDHKDGAKLLGKLRSTPELERIKKKKKKISIIIGAL